MHALVITNSITRRDEKSLDKYFNDISKYDVLTPDRELELFKAYRNGDDTAYDKLIRHNLRFVVSVAKQYQNTGLWLGDLINEGNIGLIKACQRFDETRGFKFISYAVWWIRQTILQALNEKGRKIRMPSNHYSVSSKLKKATGRYMQALERQPTVSELAEGTGLDEKLIEKNLAAYKKCSSLDAPFEEGSNSSLVTLIEDKETRNPDFNVAVRDSQAEQVKFLLNRLTPRESSIMSLYFGIDRKFPMSLDDISYQIGVSRERVRQIKDKSILKLRSRHAQMEPAF